MFGGKGSAFQASAVVYRCTSGTLHRAWHRRYKSVYKANKLLASFLKHVYFVTQMLKCNRLLIYFLANLHTSSFVNSQHYDVPGRFHQLQRHMALLSLRNRHCSVSSLLEVVIAISIATSFTPAQICRFAMPFFQFSLFFQNTNTNDITL